MGAEAPALRALPSLAAARPPAKGEVRRAALLTALEELLRERRLADVSIADIATAAGLKRSAFYYHFPGKEAAVTELLHGIFEAMLSGAQAWLDGEDDPAVSLHAALTGTVTHWRAHRHLFLAMLDARDGDPEVRALLDSWVELFVAPLAAAVAADRAAGRAPDGPPPEALIRLLLGMNERALEHNVRSGAGDAESAALRDALTRVWLSTLYAAPVHP